MGLFLDTRKSHNKALLGLLRRIEVFVYRIMMGRKIANMMKTVYGNYDHFLTESWDFEPNLPIDVDAYHPIMLKWLKDNPPPKPSTKIKFSFPFLSMGGSGKGRYTMMSSLPFVVSL